ncbi:hypothetical protein Rmf_19160 [Roseomonas fluvialis]|uniref:Transcriptional regulator n=1 Tax=Roseomonas fluvialis TaxID=1750527 RepID=A0ABN6NZZ1_9PROT|nr:hypothetical protein Rmf_19160 [Roseomonas fluvialis]
MSIRWIDAKGVVAKGLYGSIHSVHRAWKKGEIPPPVQSGRRCMWDEGALDAHVKARAGQTRPAVPRRRVIVRR